jgi:hypothetical protein
VSYTLDSAVERNREAPETFPIPGQAEREGLRPGQIVKLMFRFDGPGEETVERMWVIVKEHTPTGYLGELDNQPYTTDAIQPGAPVRFGPEHVIAIYREQPKPH